MSDKIRNPATGRMVLKTGVIGKKILAEKKKAVAKKSKHTESYTKKVSERPSPPVSATEYPVGTRKKGGDGKFWSVVKAANGVKRWKHTVAISEQRKKTVPPKKVITNKSTYTESYATNDANKYPVGTIKIRKGESRIIVKDSGVNRWKKTVTDPQYSKMDSFTGDNHIIIFPEIK